MFSIQQLILFEMGKESDLRTNPLKGGGDDAIMDMNKPIEGHPADGQEQYGQASCWSGHRQPG